MTAAVDYESHTHIVAAGGKEFTVRSMVPVYADGKQRDEDKQKIETALYNIFRNYIA